MAPWWACTGKVDHDKAAADDDSSTDMGGGGQAGSPSPPAAPTEPLSPADLQTSCTKDAAFPRRLLRLAGAEVVASLAKTNATTQVVWPGELKDPNQSPRADDSLVVSRSFYDAIHEVAIGVAKQLPQANALPCDVAKFGVEATCTNTLLNKWLPLVFRGRSDSKDVAALAGLAQTVASRSGGQRALELVVRASLQSPKFLYLAEGIDAALASKPQASPMSGPELAAYLSFHITGEPPSEALLKAVADKVFTQESLQALLKQQFSDQQRQLALADFLKHWLNTSDIAKLARDKVKHPEADAVFLTKLRDETDAAVARASSDNTMTLAKLLTSTQSSTLLDGNAGAQRPGFFALPGVVAASSAADHTNIPRRGRVLMRNLFCEEAVLPPPGVINKVPTLPDTASQRQRFEAVETQPQCAACHVTIDHLAYPFEVYDELGRTRTMDEKGNVIDTASSFTAADGSTLQYKDAREFMQKASESPLVKGCYALQSFRYVASRFERGSADACLIKDVAAVVTSPSSSLLDVLTTAFAKTALANRGDQ